MNAIRGTRSNEEIWWICQPSIDIIHRAWSSALDPAIHPDAKGFSSRLIIDACRLYEWRDRFPKVNEPSPEEKQEAREKWGYLTK